MDSYKFKPFNEKYILYFASGQYVNPKKTKAAGAVFISTFSFLFVDDFFCIHWK